MAAALIAAGCSSNTSTDTVDQGVGPSTPVDGTVPGGSDTGVAGSTGAAGDDRPRPLEPALVPLVLGETPQLQLPATLSADRSLLVDAAGTPILINGDAAWSLVVQLDPEQIGTYLTRRAEQGFNTLLINLIDNKFSANPPANAAGDQPFLAPDDFTQPNPDYFDAAHDAIRAARDAGFLVFLVPAYLGYEGGDQGWYREQLEAGPEAMRSYGRFLGERFSDLDNIIWTHGGDYAPPSEGLELIEALHEGLVEAGASQLQTAHWSRDLSSSDVPISWLDLNLTYTSGPPYAKSAADDDIAGLPHLLSEGQYEGVEEAGTPERIRVEAYQSVLSGAIGYIYGHDRVWHFSDGWEDSLDAPGADDLSHFVDLFTALPWTALDHRLADGILEQRGEIDSPEFVAAAATPDRSLVVAYLRQGGDLILNLGTLDMPSSVVWFDPTSGEQFAADGGSMGEGRFLIADPGLNQEGSPDWVVVIRQPTASP